MAIPIFGADNVIDRGLDASETTTLTVTPAAAAGFGEKQLADDRIFETFRNGTSVTTADIITDAGLGNTEDVDYFMAVGHDFSDPSKDGSGAVTLNFANSTDGVAYTTIFTVTPSTNRIIVRGFTKVTDRFFRLRITRGISFVVNIGQLQWGIRVEAPFGIGTPFDPNEESVDGRFNRSQSGNILGTVQLFTERRARVRLRLMPNSFVEGTAVGQFKEFWDNHASLLKPFLFFWNADLAGGVPPDEEDAFFGILDPSSDLRRPLTTPLDSGFRDIEFDIVGLKEQ